jgi:glyoxylase-like metal-dependent hydrolase (beta-lactamase superfamily II)
MKQNGSTLKSAIAISWSAIFFTLLLGCQKSGSAEAAKPTPSPSQHYTLIESAPGVWRLDEHGNVNMYLVVGKKKAMLIDTGCGEPGLEAAVRSVTDLPLVVVNTHGHSDHAAGNRFFPVVHVHPKDSRVARYYAGAMAVVDDAVEGTSFDLGGRSLRVIEVPGHTRGSICLLDEANRMIFTGDNNNTHVWLFLGDALSVEEYLASLEALIALSPRFDAIYPGHGERLGPDHLANLAKSCKDILKGGIQAEPYGSYAGALQYGPDNGIIAYSPVKIRKSGE